MRRTLIITAVFILTGAGRALAQTPVLESPTMPWQVVDRIITGNIIDVRGSGAVRLAGIDDAGELSRAFLAGLIASQAVRVIATTYSSAGMTEAYVYVPDGRCVNVEMLRFGYARARITPGFERASEFLGLQEDARRLKRGLWSPPAPSTAPAPAQAQPPARALRRNHVAAGAGATIGDDTGWAASFDAGVFATRAFGFYVSAGHLHDLRDASTAGSDRAWLGSAGVMLASPARAFIRPYARAGGGYTRIETGDVTRDRPFWEAGAGLLLGRGAAHADAGYMYARVDGLTVMRAFGLLGLRF